jgi:N-acetylneuraminic acid mutarotase
MAALRAGVAGAIMLGAAPLARADNWALGTPMPSAVTWTTAATLKQDIYVIGGIDDTNTILSTVRIYDPVKATWSTGPAFPAPIFGAAAAVVKGVLYVFGGYTDANETETTNAYMLNVKAKTWVAVAPMLTAQASARAVVSGTNVYVIGGNAPGSLRINTVESYNTVTNAWTAQPSLNVGKSEISAGIISGTLIAADGYTAGGVTGDNEGFTISGGTWRSLASDPVAHNGACAAAIGGKLYAADGDDNSNGAINLTESYNLKRNEWQEITDMPNIVTNASAAVYKGKLYCFGGANYAPPFQGPVTPYDYVQIYTP